MAVWIQGTGEHESKQVQSPRGRSLPTAVRTQQAGVCTAVGKGRAGGAEVANRARSSRASWPTCPGRTGSETVDSTGELDQARQCQVLVKLYSGFIMKSTSELADWVKQAALHKVGSPPPISWRSFEQKGWVRENSSPPEDLSWFSGLWTQTRTPAVSPGSPAHWWQISELLSLQSHMSRFLLINPTHTRALSLSLLILLLWRTLPN